MNQSLSIQENTPSHPPFSLHEGHHDILDGIEDMDDIFGISEEDAEHHHHENEQNDKKTNESPDTTKKNEQNLS